MIINIAIQESVIFIQKLAYYFKPKKIKKIIEKVKFDNKKNKYILIYVGNQKKFDYNDLALINTHKKKSAYIVYVANFIDFDDYEDCPVDVFINNNNVGWDFSMYKTATLYLLKNIRELPQKILYVNNSCYYFGDEKNKFFENFFDKKFDFISPFENTLHGLYSPWHLSSWCFSVSKNFFLSTEYLQFWNSYKDIRNKFYAIRNGEHLLTKVALTYSGKLKAVYDYNKILKIFKQKLKLVGYNGLKKYLSRRLIVDFSHFIDINSIDLDSDKASHLIDFVQTTIHTYFSAHLFGIFLLKFENFPFLKKDIFFFSGQSYDNLRLLKSVLQKKYSEQTSIDCMNSILKRGRYSDSLIILKLRYHLGLR
jgi:hypothetical protein